MSTEPDPSIEISGLLKPERIVIVKEDITKQALIGKLVELIVNDHPELEKDSIVNKIQQREQGISTTLDTGLSIPHARIEGINDFISSLALTPQGLVDPSGQGATIKAMFLFLSPTDSTFFQRHLKLLATLSSTFQPAFLEKISSCKTPYKLLKEISSCKR